MIYIKLIYLNLLLGTVL